MGEYRGVAGRGSPARAYRPLRITDELGRGGMGTVYRGERDDGAFAQTVAVKLIRAELASGELRRRFDSERRMVASLDHPNVARLLDAGTDLEEGAPYLVLEFVAGEPIDAFCDARALDVAQRLALFRLVCSAVHAAHQRLILHRDLKTANVLVDSTGQPKLLDFGIAKLLVADTQLDDLTRVGFARPLTPEWSSPEQLRGEPLSTASDVYSLGVRFSLTSMALSLPMRISAFWPAERDSSCGSANSYSTPGCASAIGPCTSGVAIRWSITSTRRSLKYSGGCPRLSYASWNNGE